MELMQKVTTAKSVGNIDEVSSYERLVNGNRDKKSESYSIQLPDWWKHSPIMDVFYRYGAYYY